MDFRPERKKMKKDFFHENFAARKVKISLRHYSKLVPVEPAIFAAAATLETSYI